MHGSFSEATTAFTLTDVPAISQPDIRIIKDDDASLREALYGALGSIFFMENGEHRHFTQKMLNIVADEVGGAARLLNLGLSDIKYWINKVIPKEVAETVAQQIVEMKEFFDGVAWHQINNYKGGKICDDMGNLHIDRLTPYLYRAIGYAPKEHFIALFVDKYGRLIDSGITANTVAVGTINHAPLYPREICNRALACAAAGIILVHNHPSGDPLPSREDIDKTCDVYAALKVFDITLIDHLIVSANTYRSLSNEDMSEKSTDCGDVQNYPVAVTPLKPEKKHTKPKPKHDEQFGHLCSILSNYVFKGTNKGRKAFTPQILDKLLRSAGGIQAIFCENGCETMARASKVNPSDQLTRQTWLIFASMRKLYDGLLTAQAPPKIRLDNREKVLEFMSRRVAGRSDPTTSVLYFDSRNNLIGLNTHSIGDGGKAIERGLLPKEIVAQALWRHACAVLLATNFPSGAPPEFTISNIDATTEIRSSLQPLRIVTYGHVMIG